jgi:hypothetical protein
LPDDAPVKLLDVVRIETRTACLGATLRDQVFLASRMIDGEAGRLLDGHDALHLRVPPGEEIHNLFVDPIDLAPQCFEGGDGLGFPRLRGNR